MTKLKCQVKLKAQRTKKAQKFETMTNAKAQMPNNKQIQESR
jgi:hypothetical protein